MAKSHRVFFESDSSFDEENHKSKGALKNRAMRRLAQLIQDEGFATLQEVSDPQMAEACFRMLRNENGGWMMRKVKQ